MARLNRQRSLLRITELLSEFVTMVEGENAASRLDINLHAENIFIPIFGEIFGYTDLVNLNTGSKAYPGIDLGDRTNRVAIQVTSTHSSAKVKKTLEKFADTGDYDRVRVYILTRKQGSFRKQTQLEIARLANEKKINFDHDKDVLDFRDLEALVADLPTEKVQVIERILEMEFGEDSVGDAVQALLTGIRGIPLDYSTLIHNFLTDYLKAPFGGRDQHLAKLDEWLHDQTAPPYALLSAEAGRGKSALLVHWAASVEARSLAHVAFIPISLRYETSQSQIVFASLAARLGEIYGTPEPFNPISAEEWKAICHKYLEHPPPDGKPLLLILDGLDEARGWEAGHGLLSFSPPSGVRAVVSARYLVGDVDGRDWLRRLGWDQLGRGQAFDLPALTQGGVKDVLLKMGNPLDRLATRVDVIKELFRLSEGDPLMVRLYVEALLPFGKDGIVALESDKLPGIRSGLGGYFDF